MSDHLLTSSTKPLPGAVKKTCDLFRLLAGHELLGLAPGEIGDDAHAYAWVEKVRAARERLAS